MTDKEKVTQWMIQQGYATGHGDTVEDLLKELEWQIAENWTNALVKGVEGEREACLQAVEKAKVHQFILYPKGSSIDANKLGEIYAHQHAECVKAIRARSEK